MVNTVFIARELDVVSSSLSPEAPSRSHMDVDDVFICSVCFLKSILFCVYISPLLSYCDMLDFRCISTYVSFGG